MLVRCISNRIKDFVEHKELYEALELSCDFPSGIMHLTCSKHYVVFAVCFGDVFPRFFIADDVFSSYPISYPAPIFDVIDERCSQYWMLPEEQKKLSLLENPLPTGNIVSIKQWVQGGQKFYEKLVDGEEKEEEIFLLHKELMDLEFLQPLFKNVGVYLQDYWVQCPVCMDAWETKAKSEMLRCPTCGEVILNPTI